MELFLKITLMAHIICGFTALAMGIFALAARKGQKLHRAAGKVFFYSLLGVSATAITIASIKSNDFLFMIGIFAFFQNYSGYRSIKNKTLKPNIADWLVLLIAAINSVYMLCSLKLVLMVFGGISASLVISDARLFVSITRGRAAGKKQWLLRHIGMMTGAFIATATAFVVVNVRHANPPWLPWLLHTAILVTIIIYWTRKVEKTARP
jgi:hypothetical protein